MIRTVWLIVLGSILLAGLVHAAPLKLVSGPDFAPYVDPESSDGGLIMALAREAFAVSGTSVALELRPWACAIKSAKDSAFDAVLPLTKNPERERDFIVSAPLISMRHRFFVRAGFKRLDVDDPSSLAGTSYCVPLGRAINLRLVELVDKGVVKKESPAGTGNCILMLKAKRVDFFVADEREGFSQLAEHGLHYGSIIAVDGPPITEISLHLMASKNATTSKQLVESFNTGLDTIRKNGTYARILQRYAPATKRN